MGYSPWGHKELDILVQLTLSLSSAVSQEKSVCVCVCTHTDACAHMHVCVTILSHLSLKKRILERRFIALCQL